MADIGQTTPDKATKRVCAAQNSLRLWTTKSVSRVALWNYKMQPSERPVSADPDEQPEEFATLAEMRVADWLQESFGSQFKGMERGDWLANAREVIAIATNPKPLRED